MRRAAVIVLVVSCLTTSSAVAGSSVEGGASSNTLGTAAVPRYYVSLAEAGNLFLKIGGHLGFYRATTAVEDEEFGFDESLFTSPGAGRAPLRSVLRRGRGRCHRRWPFSSKRWLTGSGDEERFEDTSDVSIETTTIASRSVSGRSSESAPYLAPPDAGSRIGSVPGVRSQRAMTSPST